MRILVFTTYFHPHKGGLEKNTFELFNRLAEKKNVQVDVLCFNTERVAAVERRENLNIYRVDCRNILGGTYALPKLESLRRVWRELAKNNYTHVNTQTRFFLTSFLGWWFARRKKIPLIHTERGTSFAILKNKTAEKVAWLYDQILGRLILSQADMVVGVSQAAVDFARDKLGAKNTRVIHNGIAFEKFAWDFDGGREWLDIPPKDLVITFVGRLIPAKGVQDLLRALEKADLPKWTLLVTGKGFHREFLSGLAIDLGIRDKVRFLGLREPKEVRRILQVTDIFVNPSHTEGLPTTVIEAGAAGRAVIATDVGGTAEIVTDEKDGLLFQARDVKTLRKHLEKLARDKDLRCRFGERLLKSVRKKFNWEKVVEEYWAVFGGK